MSVSVKKTYKINFQDIEFEIDEDELRLLSNDLATIFKNQGVIDLTKKRTKVINVDVIVQFKDHSNKLFKIEQLRPLHNQIKTFDNSGGHIKPPHYTYSKELEQKIYDLIQKSPIPLDNECISITLKKSKTTVSTITRELWKRGLIIREIINRTHHYKSKNLHVKVDRNLQENYALNTESLEHLKRDKELRLQQMREH